MIFLQLFYTFFKIGLFGFGGGYAMLSMIQGEVVTRYEWLTSSEFTDIVAISNRYQFCHLCRLYCGCQCRIFSSYRYVGLCGSYLFGSSSIVYSDDSYK